MIKQEYEIPINGRFVIFKEEPIDLITVCSNCFCASCWNGIFMCDKSDIAGTIDLPIKFLDKLNLENRSYYNG